MKKCFDTDLDETTTILIGLRQQVDAKYTPQPAPIYLLKSRNLWFPPEIKTSEYPISLPSKPFAATLAICYVLELIGMRIISLFKTETFISCLSCKPLKKPISKTSVPR
jgi:hypothetical protein